MLHHNLLYNMYNYIYSNKNDMWTIHLFHVIGVMFRKTMVCGLLHHNYAQEYVDNYI